VSPERHWDFTLWGKNLADEEYVQSVFVTALFTNMLVANGQGLSWGGTVKYNF
jgi:outer membrane receptor protein involved in Fe transport